MLRYTNATFRERKDPAVSTYAGSNAGADDTGLEVWCIETLVAQLNGGEPPIVRAALSVLEEASQDERCLRTLVRPS